MTIKLTRTPLLLVSALLAALSAETSLAGVGSWTNSWPDGGSVLIIASHPYNPSVVYAATSRGLYKSADGGGFWTLVRSGTFGHVIPTSDPSVVYVTHSGQTISRTTDGAQTWTDLGSAGTIYALTVEPNDPRTLYAITVQGLLRSADGALTWERLPNPAGATFGSTAFAVDPVDSRFLYALAVTGQGFAVHRSSDRGATWSPTSLREAPRAFLFDPGNPSRLFAATGAGLYVTTDRGGSWRRLGAQQDFTQLAIDPANSGRLYAISLGVIYRSSNGGETMTRVSADLGLVATIAASADVVLAGSEIGAYRSDDGGGEWRAASRGIREISVRSLAIDPSDPSVVLAASGLGIYESRNGAASWSGLLTRIPTNAVAFDPTNRSTLYAAGQGGVSKSIDGGRSWQARGGLAYLTDLLIDPNNARRILASNGRVYRSADGADSWTPVLTPEEDYAAYYYPPTVTSMDFAPSDPTVVYAGASESPRSVYRSQDAGESWTALAAHLPGLNALTIDSCDPAIVHAGTSNGGHRTFDGGQTWTQTSQLPQHVLTLARDPRHPSSVFAGTAAGLFWTNDRGATWTRFEPALLAPVRALALDPSGRFLHAVTDSSGLYPGELTGQGVFSLERVFDACTQGADRLCLVGKKYQVSLTARHPRTGALVTGRAIEEGDQFGYFSFPDVTGDASFPEVFVKMVDAMAAPPPYGGHAWVFHSSLTDLDYTLTVLETGTGRVRTYAASDAGTLTCGWSDTSAFVRGCTNEDGAASSNEPGARLAASSGAELALLNGRFRAFLRATDPRTGRIGEGAALSRADGFGYFSLPAFTGDPSFPEVFVKMTDATGLAGGGFWVFHTGLTDVGYTLTVTDTATGAVKTYRREAPTGPGLCGQADTSAFPN
jgi:photosystem II stability/assembly factor-like uncharacterized protein